MAWLLVGLGVGQIGLIVAAFSRLIDPGWPAYGAIYTSVRAIIEACYLAGVLNPPPPQPTGTSSGFEGIFVGAVILSGFVLPAFWEISLARWMLSRRRMPAI